MSNTIRRFQVFNAGGHVDTDAGEDDDLLLPTGVQANKSDDKDEEEIQRNKDADDDMLLPLGVGEKQINTNRGEKQTKSDESDEDVLLPLGVEVED